MNKYGILLAAAFVSLQSFAQEPIYIVNGVERTEIHSIPPADIEKIDLLPADETTIARYGEKADHGVMLITLRYDTPAQFDLDGLTFNQYIARQIRWTETDPTARLILRYTITAEGKMVIGEILEATDSRFKRLILKCIEESPAWIPATKAGQAVDSERILSILLPEGGILPQEPALIIQ
ncbi:MAG: TonB-dependent receptor [Alistipes sp.]